MSVAGSFAGSVVGAATSGARPGSIFSASRGERIAFLRKLAENPAYDELRIQLARELEKKHHEGAGTSADASVAAAARGGARHGHGHSHTHQTHAASRNSAELLPATQRAYLASPLPRVWWLLRHILRCGRNTEAAGYARLHDRLIRPEIAHNGSGDAVSGCFGARGSGVASTPATTPIDASAAEKTHVRFVAAYSSPDSLGRTYNGRAVQWRVFMLLGRIVVTAALLGIIYSYLSSFVPLSSGAATLSRELQGFIRDLFAHFGSTVRRKWRRECCSFDCPVPRSRRHPPPHPWTFLHRHCRATTL